MPDDIKQTWQKFVGGLRSLFGTLPEHRHQDQFLSARIAALDLAASDEMAQAVKTAYESTNVPEKRPMNIVLLELEAFPLAVSIHEAAVKEGVAKPGAQNQLLSAGKTILGSVGDVFSLSPFGKGVVSVLKEAVELFGSP